MSRLKLIKENIKENWLEYLMYLFVFLLPWQTRWIVRDFFIQGDIFEYDRISLYGFDILLVILLIGYFIFGRQGKKVRLNRGILVLAVSFIIYSLLSVLWANDKLISLYWGVRMMLGGGLFYLIQKINFSKVRLALVVVISGAIQGLLAIWQFLYQDVWGLKWLGMAAQNARELGTSVVEFGLERWLRAYGSLPHPNILGACLVLSFIGVIYLTTRIEDKYHKLFLIFSSSFIWLGIFFSFSRGAWIVFSLAFILGIIYIFKVGDVFVKKFSRVLWIYGLILLSVFIWTTLPIVKTRLNIGQPARLEVKSNMERLDSYGQAGEIIRENWLVGVGMGNYTFELQNKHPDLKAWDIWPVHNVYLLILAEIGLLGILIMGLWMGYILYLLIKNKKWSYVGLLLVVYGLFMFDHFWWTLASGLYIIWLVMGLAVRENIKKE